MENGELPNDEQLIGSMVRNCEVDTSRSGGGLVECRRGSLALQASDLPDINSTWMEML
jgi:hypothetical protein